jgi:hypothetical protein
MAFGKLRKIWEKIKGTARKVWGGIKKVLPFVKPMVSTIANVVAPGSGFAINKGIEPAENIGDALASGDIKRATGSIPRPPGFLPMGERLRLTG